jgi:hypothetical protein
MSNLDKIAVAFAVLVVGGLLLAFFLYLRSSYRRGGWKRVGTDFVIALFALFALYVIRSMDTAGFDSLKEAMNQVKR